MIARNAKVGGDQRSRSIRTAAAAMAIIIVRTLKRKDGIDYVPVATLNVRRAYLQDCNDRTPAWHTANRDQPGPLQLIQAPGRREPGRDRTRPNPPTPARNRPIASIPPRAKRPKQLGETSPGAGRPEATSSKGSDHTTADTSARPPAPGDPRPRPPACNLALVPRSAIPPARPNGNRVGPIGWRSAHPWRTRQGRNGLVIGIDNRETDTP